MPPATWSYCACGPAWCGVALLDVVARGVVRRPAGDRLAAGLVGVLDLLPGDRDLAVLVVPEVGGAELGRRSVLVAGLAVGAAERLVLGLAVRPVLELVGRALLLDPAHLLTRLLGVLLLLARLGG